LEDVGLRQTSRASSQSGIGGTAVSAAAVTAAINASKVSSGKASKTVGTPVSIDEALATIDTSVTFANDHDWTSEERFNYLDSLGLVNIPGEEVVIRFLEDTLSLAPLPSPWVQGRDEENRLFWANGDTGESVWSHPLEQVMRELVGVCRMALRLPSGLRDACIASIHSNWKDEAVREYERWYPILDEESGQNYYCNKESEEVMWGVPADIILPAFHVKLRALDRLRDEQYVMGIHERIQADTQAATQYQMSQPGSPSAGSMSPKMRKEDRKELELALEVQEKLEAVQVERAIDERRKENKEFEMQIRHAAETLHGDLARANSSMGSVIRDEFTKALHPMSMGIANVTRRKSETQARFRASDEKLGRELAAVNEQVKQAAELIRNPPEARDEKGWWWATEPPKFERYQGQGDRAYNIGAEEARRKLKERGYHNADDLIPWRQKVEQVEDRLRKTFEERVTMREELLSLREAELRRQEKESHYKYELRKRMVQTQQLLERREVEWKQEIAKLSTRALRPLSRANSFSGSRAGSRGGSRPGSRGSCGSHRGQCLPRIMPHSRSEGLLTPKSGGTMPRRPQLVLLQS